MLGTQIDEKSAPLFKDGKLMLKDFGCAWCGKSVVKSKEHYEVVHDGKKYPLHIGCWDEWEEADAKEN